MLQHILAKAHSFSGQARFAADHRYHMLRGKLTEQRTLIRESDSATRRKA
jgi:hypothetical protein